MGCGVVQGRLRERGLTLPDRQAPAHSYVPAVRVGPILFVSGQLPWTDGRIEHVGTLGAGASLEMAQTAARLCALNMLTQVREACEGDLDRVARCVKLGGFVSADGGFRDFPAVIDAASAIMIDAFGEAGRHARFAVGSSALPRGVLVEVEGVFEIGAARG